MKENLYICIMAGGSGTRLWPMSRCSLPKQFHNLCGEESLIKETYQRLAKIVKKENIFVSLVSDILEPAKKELKDIPKDNFIIEPEGRNTAPALALAAARIFKINPEAIVIATPSDHTIEKEKHFQEALLSGANFVQEHPDYLVTLGIKPDHPETGYGYIKIGEKFQNSSLLKVDKFEEKPNLETAQKYLKSGKFLWNAGYFIWKASTLLEMFEEFQPEMKRGLEKILKSIGTKDEEKTVQEEYNKFPQKPIDTAIAEKTNKIAVVPADLGWSDIGNWAALYDLLSKKNKITNVSRGHHLGYNNKNCLIYAQDKLLATVGLQDIIIVDTPDVTLVCNKDKTQEVKKLIEELKKQGKVNYL